MHVPLGPPAPASVSPALFPRHPKAEIKVTPAHVISEGEPQKEFKRLRILYLFGGTQSRGMLKDSAEKRAQVDNMELNFQEVDMVTKGSRGSPSEEAEWLRVIGSIRSGQWDFIFVSPPCETYTTSKGASATDPPHVRSAEHPNGFPWLKGAQKKRVEDANELVGRAVQAILEGRKSSAATAFVLEHPENMGSRGSEHTPASIWDLQVLRDLSDEPGVTQGAMFHCSFGPILLLPLAS